MGCSLANSSAPIMRKASRRSMPSAHTTLRNCMTPVVTVPVLSNTTVSIRRVLCSTSTPLITMPSWAPRPLPTISAVGVAKPNAQGQAIMRTATAAVNAFVASPSTTNHAINVTSEMSSTTGTKMLLTLSASFCTGAFVACASRTNFAICAKVVSAPTRETRTFKRPVKLIVAPVTASPATTSTGTLSPVSMDISMLESPSITTPSVAIFSPGRTTITSFTCKFLASTSRSTPFSKTTAVCAPIAKSARRALPALRFARASK